MPSGNPLGFERTGDGWASRAQALISRQTYQDFLNRFGGLESNLASIYANPVLRQEGAQQAASDVTGAFRGISGQQERYMRGLGLEMTQEQQASSDRNRNLAQGLATVTAMNRSLTASDDRDRMIVAGARTEG